MSAAQVLEQLDKLPFEEQREVFAQLRRRGQTITSSIFRHRGVVYGQSYGLTPFFGEGYRRGRSASNACIERELVQDRVEDFHAHE